MACSRSRSLRYASIVDQNWHNPSSCSTLVSAVHRGRCVRNVSRTRSPGLTMTSSRTRRTNSPNAATSPAMRRGDLTARGRPHRDFLEDLSLPTPGSDRIRPVGDSGYLVYELDDEEEAWGWYRSVMSALSLTGVMGGVAGARYGTRVVMRTRCV